MANIGCVLHEDLPMHRCTTSLMVVDLSV